MASMLTGLRMADQRPMYSRRRNRAADQLSSRETRDTPCQPMSGVAGGGTADIRRPGTAGGGKRAAGSPAGFSGDGLFVVGLAIKPGVYRTAGPASGRAGSFALLKSTSTRDIVNNSIVRGPATITVGPGVKAVEVRKCQPCTGLAQPRRGHRRGQRAREHRWLRLICSPAQVRGADRPNARARQRAASSPAEASSSGTVAVVMASLTGGGMRARLSPSCCKDPGRAGPPASRGYSCCAQATERPCACVSRWWCRSRRLLSR